MFVDSVPKNELPESRNAVPIALERFVCNNLVDASSLAPRVWRAGTSTVLSSESSKRFSERFSASASDPCSASTASIDLNKSLRTSDLFFWRLGIRTTVPSVSTFITSNVPGGMRIPSVSLSWPFFVCIARLPAGIVTITRLAVLGSANLRLSAD